MRDAMITLQPINTNYSPFISSHPMRDAIAAADLIDNLLAIYILASHEGCYLDTVRISFCFPQFISSHPMRDAIWFVSLNDMDVKNLYPRIP